MNWGKMWEEMVVGYFKLPFQQVPRGAVGNHEKQQHNQRPSQDSNRKTTGYR
jgi:hypothetical protein